MNIIAMGGGGFSMEPDNPRLDRYIINQSEQLRPKICFLPTASGDSEEYIQKFYTFFQEEDCEPTHLSLLKPEVADKETFLLSQDIIYVGGGNTRNLMALWKEWELDRILEKAWKNGTILAGISAGSICWFDEGPTDSVPGEVTKVKGLGFLHGSTCPHYDNPEESGEMYRHYVANEELSAGYAMDDGAAIHFVGTDIHKAISSRPEAKAYHVSKGENGQDVNETPLEMEYITIE